MSATTLSLQEQVNPKLFLKVPEITALFWIIKILTTAMGEAASDFFVHLDASVAFLGALVIYLVSLAIQFRTKRYNAWAYWFQVAMVGIFGTMAADGLHKAGISIPTYTAAYGVLLLVVLGLWYAVEGTLSVHDINTPRREGFYWLTVLVCFAFGTATGDWTADTLHLGTLDSGLIFTGLFVLPAIAFYLLRANAIVTFWIAYVITRPLGASFADWAGDPVTHAGLGLGKGHVAAVLTVVIVAFVAYLAAARRDVPHEAA